MARQTIYAKMPYESAKNHCIEMLNHDNLNNSNENN